MATYRRRKRIWYLGGRRQVTRSRSRSPKHPSSPGRGWFSWAWGGKSRNRTRINLPAFFTWEKRAHRRLRRR